MMFIIYTILFWLANACVLFILHVAIQPGQMFEAWGDKLIDWDRRGKLFLSKAGGLCEMCYSFWFSLILSPVYVYFVHELWTFGIVVSIIWFIIYHSIATVSTLWILKNI